MIDCHIHTARCGHAFGSVAEMVAAAESLGLAAVALTEHLPLPSGLDPAGEYAMGADEIGEYAREVLEVAADSSIDVILAAEADWIPSRAAECEAIRNRAHEAGIHVLLGSVHFLDDWAFDDPSLVSRWDENEVLSVWERYFDEWCLAAASGYFDVMAHPDLVKKFGHVPLADLSDIYQRAAEAAASSGVMIEVSTAGLRKPIGELYPGTDLLAAFANAGVPATTSSDSHAPFEVGYRLNEAVHAMHEAGYRRVGLPLGGGEVRWYDL